MTEFAGGQYIIEILYLIASTLFILQTQTTGADLRVQQRRTARDQ